MKEIIRYFPEISDIQKNQFQQLEELYVYWNERINLISRKDIDQLYIRHVLHSLAIAKIIKFTDGTRVLDVGTGGGFPGIPLAIMFPGTELLLIDSINKKITAVNDIVGKLGLANCKAMTIRAEQVKEQFHFIVSRAVAPLPTLYKWVKKNISKTTINTIPNGIICLKGGDLMEEMATFENWHTSRNIKDFFDDDFFETKKIIHLFKP